MPILLRKHPVGEVTAYSRRAARRPASGGLGPALRRAIEIARAASHRGGPECRVKLRAPPRLRAQLKTPSSHRTMIKLSGTPSSHRISGIIVDHLPSRVSLPQESDANPVPASKPGVSLHQPRGNHPRGSLRGVTLSSVRHPGDQIRIRESPGAGRAGQLARETGQTGDSRGRTTTET
jgi:hypothetical protein